MSFDPTTSGTFVGKWRRLHKVNLTRGGLLLLLRRPLIAILHAWLIGLAWFGSFAIRLDFVVSEPFLTPLLTMLPFVIILKLAVFYSFRLFQGWWQYVGLSDLIDIAKATAIGTLCIILATLTIYGRTLTIDRGGKPSLARSFCSTSC